MLKFTKKLHDAKTGFMSTTYRGIASEIMAEYVTDTDGISAEIMAVLNTDYPIADCKDNKVLTTALNSMQRAFKDTGEALPDGLGGKLVYTFSTTGGKGNKSRTVSCQYVTAEEIETAEARAKQDAAIVAERAAEDEKHAEKKARLEMQALTPLDVFMRVFKGAETAYPDHDMVEVISAGLAFYEEKSAEIETLPETEGEKLDGTNG